MGAAFEVNRQMCDIGRLISVEEMADRYNKQILQSRLDGLSAWLKLQDMEEKKTKKMTKAEAFEYLKGKKVSVSGEEMNDRVQSKLFACGVQWKNGGTNVCYYSDYLVINPYGFLCHCDGMGKDYWNRLFHEEISTDDILSIEIVEGTPKFSYEKVVESAKPLMEYLNDTGCTEQIGVSYDHIVALPMATFLHGEMKGC